MTIIREQQFLQFVKNPDPAITAILLYGTDQTGVHDRAKSLVEAYAGPLAENLNIVRLEEKTLREDSSILADEYRAISMFGGRRAIWIREAANTFQKTVEDCLSDPVSDVLIVAEAGRLAKGAALRKYFEQAGNALILACYEDTRTSLETLLQQSLAPADMKISRDAAADLIARFGSNRQTLRNELEKLCCYCHGREEISIDDVHAVSQGDIDADLYELGHMIGQAELAAASQRYERLVEAGNDPGTILLAIERHFARLERLSVATQATGSADMAIKTLRPPVFFKDVERFKKQVRHWPPAKCRLACTRIWETLKALRSTPAQPAAAAERAVLALCHMALSAR